MKGSFAIALGIIPAAVLAQAVQAGSGGYGPTSPFTTQYDAGHQVVFSGKVVGKSVYRPQPGMAESEQILVKNSKGTYEVHLGPAWFVNNQVAHVYIGEHVRVIGSSVRLYNAPIVLAKQIVNTDNNHVLALRDLSGWPYWVATRDTNSPSVASAPTPNQRSVSGPVQSMTTVNINGVPYQAYVVQTSDGTVNVLTAPTWYMNGQDFSVPIGTYINAIGGAGPISLGNGTIIANSLGAGSSTILLRDNGFPIWQGFQPIIVQ